MPGINDVLTYKPELINIWHPTKNGDLKLNEFPKCSEKKVWWRCSKGHEFERTIYSRYVAKNLCPICAGKRI
ncbi:MAG: zinc-ribbon domain-containing protein [Clostridia bacterium]|mgnify:CR=1 FL=1|nr:zinc-ribbon domain-containing protein [Clostridia bacterium]